MGKRAHGEGTIYGPRKDGRWHGSITIGYTPEGKQKRRSVYGRTQAEARAKLDELKREVSGGTYVDDTRDVAEYLAEWLKHKGQRIKPRTSEIYKGLIEKHITPRIGRVQLAKLKPMQVQQAVAGIAGDVGVSTANKCRRVLYGAFKQAVRWQVLSRNPVEAVDPLREQAAEIKLWTSSEAARFLDTARAHRLYPVFYLLMAAGLRRGEALGLYWSDLKGDRLRIKRSLTTMGGKPVWSEPKTRRGNRTVVLPADALTVLKEHRQRQQAERQAAGEFWAESELMFTNEIGQAVTPAAMHHHWLKLQAAAGVPQLRPHDMRHLHVSLLIKRGLDVRTIADRIGHCDPAFTLRRYGHMFDEHRPAGAVNLSDLLGSSTPSAAQN
jgi:integrase